MRKALHAVLLGAALLGVEAADAATVRVEFSGTTNRSAAFGGYFSFDDAILDPSGTASASVPPGLELALSFVLDGTEVFNELSASVGTVTLSAGSVTRFFLGGDLNGGTFDSSQPPDVFMGFVSGPGPSCNPCSIQLGGISSQQSLLGLTVTATVAPVPLPAGLHLLLPVVGALGLACRRRPPRP